MKIELVRAIAYQTVGLLLVVVGIGAAALGATSLIIANQDCYSFLSDEGPCLLSHEVLQSQAIGYLVAAGVMLLGAVVLLSMVKSTLGSAQPSDDG